ncbi:MAG: CvpA family protein [bacterium]|nr:CvpA family protein [bacterium]
MVDYVNGSKISLDIISIILILLGFFWGLRRGFIRSLFFLLGIIVAIYLGNLGTKIFVKDVVDRFNISKDIAGLIIFIIIFFISLSLINVIGFLIRRPKKGMGRLLDGLGGCVLGIVWGFGICGFLGIILSRFELTKSLLSSTIILGMAESWIRKMVERILSYGTW